MIKMAFKNDGQRKAVMSKIAKKQTIKPMASMSKKIKGWSKTLELPYRIDYNNTTGRYNKQLGMGDRAIIISAVVDNNSKSLKLHSDFTGDWEVTYRTYVQDIGQRYGVMGTFKTKQQAMDFAVKYMKEHFKG